MDLPKKNYLLITFVCKIWLWFISVIQLLSIMPNKSPLRILYPAIHSQAWGNVASDANCFPAKHPHNSLLLSCVQNSFKEDDQVLSIYILMSGLFEIKSKLCTWLRMAAGESKILGKMCYLMYIVLLSYW